MGGREGNLDSTLHSFVGGKHLHLWREEMHPFRCASLFFSISLPSTDMCRIMESERDKE